MKLATILAIFPMAFAAPAPAPALAPRDGDVIPGKYIIKFRNILGVDFDTLIQPALELLKKDPIHLYNFSGFAGFSAEISDDIVSLLRLLPIVEYVEEDRVIKANLAEVVAVEKRAYTTENSAPWGISRLSSNSPGSSSYTYDSSAGVNTCVYVVDTGIDVSNPEFEGRATFAANIVGDGQNTDGNGHGTHVAGIVGSKTYGVAKRTKLYAVKVLDANGSGNSSGIIAGINYVVNDYKSRGCTSTVVNMSLGGNGQSSALNSAAANAVSAGLFMAVAAGNSAQDASNTCPASEPSVFTVGATNSTDFFAYYSNYGSVVDMLAPGDMILSTYINGLVGYLSGTSMAAPHIAGLAAYLLAFEGQKSVDALTSRIKSLGLQNKIKGVPSGTVNLLASNGYANR